MKNDWLSFVSPAAFARCYCALRNRRRSTSLGAGDYFVYVGSYTNPTPTTTSAAKGIYAWRFDSKTGALTPIGLAAETVNPAHVWAHPNGRFLYASNWEDGTPGDHVSAFAIDHRTGLLKLLNKVEREGRSRQPGGARSERQARGDGHLQQRHVLGVWRRARWQAHRGVLHGSAHRQAAQREAAGSARARHRLFKGRPIRLRRRARARSRVTYTASIRSSGRPMPADPPFVTMNAGGSGPRRLQLHPNGKIPLREPRDRLEGQRLRSERRRPEADSDALDAAGRPQRQQHDGRDSDRSDGQVALRHQPRPRQHGALRR